MKDISSIDFTKIGWDSKLDIGKAEAIRLGMLTDRSIYEPTWQALAEYVAPSRYVDTPPTDRNSIRKRSKQILDSTARLGIRTFVAGMMNGATSRARPWWTLVPIEERFNNPETERFLFQVVNTTNKTFEISNLYNVLPHSYKDLGIFGNSAYAMLPHPKTAFYFKYFPVGSYCIGTDSEGNVNQFQYDSAITVRQCVEMFGKLTASGHIDWTGMDPYVAMQYVLGNYHYSVVISTLIMPNPTPKPDSLLPDEAGKYVSYTWVRGVGNSIGNYLNPEFYTGFRYTNQIKREEMDPKLSKLVGEAAFLEVRAFDYFPVIANRWEVAPNGDYGIDSPVELAIGEIISLQGMERDRQDAVAKLVKPPMKGPVSLKRVHASIVSGGMTYLDEGSVKNAAFEPVFKVDPKIQELLQNKSEYQMIVRKALFEDIFLMMSGEQKLSHVTAQEIAERASEKLVAVGPALGQIDKDQNNRLVEHGVKLNYKVKGRMPPMPEYLKGAGFQPEYISILAQAQKASMINSQDNFTNYAAAVANLTQNPTVVKILDPIKMIRARASYLGVDPSMILTDDEFEQIVQAAAQKNMVANQQQQSLQSAEIAEKLSKAEPSPDNMLGQFAEMSRRI